MKWKTFEWTEWVRMGVTQFKHDNLELAKVVTFDEDALDSQIDQLNCMQASEQREPGGCNCFRIYSGRIFFGSGRLWYNDR